MTKTKDGFQFLGLEFQERLLKQFLEDRRFTERIVDIIDPNYFTDESLRMIAVTIKNAHEQYEAIPDAESLKMRIRDSVDNEIRLKLILAEVDRITNASENDGIFVQERAIKFCKQQELVKSVREIQKFIDRGDDDYEQCADILRKALEAGETTEDDCNVLDGLEEVLSSDYRKPIRTGIMGLDDLMGGGLSRGELALILAPFGVGKAQPLSAKVLTPKGWSTMGSIEVGDKVIGRDGKPTNVIGVYPQGLRPIYKVRFNDNTETLCDGEHLWSVNTIQQRNRKTRKGGKLVKLPSDNTFKVMKTTDMIGAVKVWGGRRLNYKIPNVSPVEFDNRSLPINPYLLGVILGDGCITESNQPHFVTKDVEIINEVRKYHEDISVTEQIRDIEIEEGGELVLVKRTLTKVSLLGIKPDLCKLNLYGCNSKTKFIPNDYLYSSIDDRVALLQGLIDTDGYIDAHRIEISTVSKTMAYQIKELVMSLGGTCNIGRKVGSYSKNGVKILCEEVYRLNFSFPNTITFKVARLNRKSDKLKLREKYAVNKFISSIEYSHDEEAKCIMVENPEHLYVTDDYIVTHNTTMITKLANSAMNDGLKVLQIFFEDTTKVIKRKHLSCWTEIPLNELSDPQWRDRLNKEIEVRTNGKGRLLLKKFPSDGTTIPKIRQYIKKKISQGFRPDIVLLDYIDCVVPTKEFKDEYAGEGNVMRQFESMLSEFDIAGWTAVQGNRSSIGAEVVEADQMAGSIKKGMIGHFIVSIAKTLPQKECGRATMAILKSRFGKDGVIFSDIKFDNSTIQIDITNKNGGQSFLEKNVEKAVDTQDKIKSIMRIAAQQKEEREAREAQEALRRGTVLENNVTETE